MAKARKAPDSFASRMRGYEAIASTSLMRRTPVIVRIDGKNFSRLTRGLGKPFDRDFMHCMEAAAHFLCKEAQCVRMAYFQSDEISLLLTDYKSLNTQPWFNNRVQKMCSIGAAMATAGFCEEFHGRFNASSFPIFDARVFNIPREEVTNYFVFRQRDASRNSVSMAARANFSHKELVGQNREQMMDMLMLRKTINWNDYDVVFKRGACVVKETVVMGEKNVRSHWVTDWDIPIFSRQRDYVDRFVRDEERLV